MVIFPRLHRYHASSEVGQVIQGPRHGAEHAWYALLTRRASTDTHLWPSSSRTAESVDAREVGWNTDRAGNIGTNANAASSERQEGCFATSRATGRVFGVVRIGATTPDLYYVQR